MSYRCYRNDRHNRDSEDSISRFNHAEFDFPPVKLENSRSCLLRTILLSSVFCTVVVLFTFAVVVCHNYSQEIASLRYQLPAALQKASDIASTESKSTAPRVNDMTRRLLSTLYRNGSVSVDALHARFPAWFRIRADGQRIMRTSTAVIDLVEIIGSLAE